MNPSAQRHEAILEIEDSLRNESWFVDGMDMTPLARLILWSEFKYGHRSRKSMREVTLRSKLGPVVTESRSRLARFGSIQVPNFRSVSPDLSGTLSDAGGQEGTPLGLFAISRTHIHTSPDFGIVDRVYSPLGRRLRHQTVGVEIESMPRHAIQPGPKVKSELKRLSLAFRAHVKTSGMAHLFSGDLASIFYVRGRSVLNARAWSRHLLDRHRQLSYLALSGWYSPGAMGLTAAFSERGILTVDLQHGQQGPYQSMYVDWSVRWAPEASLLPAEFWLWGRETQERISPRNAPDAPSSRIVGYPFLRDMLGQVSKGPLGPRNYVHQDPRRRVVVALQGQHIDLNGVIPDELKRFMHREKATFVVRQHPNTPLSERERQSLRHEFSESAVFDDGRRPLPFVLAGADALISGFSSAVLEAAYMRIPSLVWAPVASDQYTDLIAAGLISADPSQSTSLEEIICRGQQADWSALEDYISSSYEDLTDALEVLEGAVSKNADA